MSGSNQISRASACDTIRSAPPIKRWLMVANGSAGEFKALHVARESAAALSGLGHEVISYKTQKVLRRRIDDIDRLVTELRPSKEAPLGVLAFGGDGTIRHVMQGAVERHLFPDTREILSLSAKAAAERMTQSGIYLGAVQAGGANDIGSLYGAPELDVDDIVDYVTNARLTNLNRGLAIFAGQDPVIFYHSLLLGKTIAPLFEMTRDDRGRAARMNRQIKGWHRFLWRHPVIAQWQKAGEPVNEEIVLEVLAHATVRADGINGFPGTPQPGIGVKIIPKLFLPKQFLAFFEILWRGLSSKWGNPTRLLPDASLVSVDNRFQPALVVGEEMVFRFLDITRNPVEVPIALDGDCFVSENESVIRANAATIRALSPFPNFLVRENSLMANLRLACGNP